MNVQPKVCKYFVHQLQPFHFHGCKRFKGGCGYSLKTCKHCPRYEASDIVDVKQEKYLNKNSKNTPRTP